MKTEDQEQHEVMRLIKGELPMEIVKRHHDNKVAEFSNCHGFSLPLLKECFAHLNVPFISAKI